MSVRDMVVEFNEKGFKQLQDKIEKLEKGLKKQKVNIETKEAEKALKKLEKEAEKRTKAIKKTFSKIGKGLNVGLGIGASVVGGVLYGMDKYLDKVDNIVNATSRMGGASTDMIQVLTAMGKEAGFTGEHIEGAFKQMNKISADMGIKGSADERFLKFADYIANIKDPAKQSAEAMRIFSETGIKMLPMLKNGSKALDEYKKAMGKALISKESIDNAMKIKNEMNKLTLAVEGVKTSFFDAFSKEINGGSVFDNLNESLDRFAKIDFAPMAKAMMDIVNMSVTFLSNISKGFALWQENSEIEKNNREEQARRDWQAGKYNIDEIEKREKEALKPKAGAGLFANIFAGKSMVNNSAINDLRSTDFGKLRYAENKIEKALKSNQKVSKDIIEDLTEVMKRGFHQTYKDQARELLKKAGINIGETKTGDTKTGDTKTGDNKKGTTTVINTSGGRTSSGIGGGVETISVLMHFKNEFTVFARKLLKLQERGTTYGGQQIRDNRAISLSVNVTANNKSGKELGDEVAKSISKSLKDILNTNTSIIQSIKQHEDTVKEITKDDGKTASIRPSSEPIANPMA